MLNAWLTSEDRKEKSSGHTEKTERLQRGSKALEPEAALRV